MKCENPRVAACPYDVGDILTTTSSKAPSERWPGTEWTQIKDRFLLGAGDKHVIGSTGGSETHTLTEDELPKISGSIYAGAGNSGAKGNGWGAFRQGSGCFSTHMEMQYGQPAPNCGAEFPSGSQSAAWAYADLKIGGGQSHTNMPPYLTVYVWKRTK